MNLTGIPITTTNWNYPDLPIEHVVELFNRWDEPHRTWHSKAHLDDLIDRINNTELLIPSHQTQLLKYVALFHDIIYDPSRDDNEDQSAILASKYLKNYSEKRRVVEIILSTKHHSSTDKLGQIFHKMDCAILEETDISKLLEYEEGISFEYKNVDPKIYCQKRCAFLRQAANEYNNTYLEQLAFKIEYDYKNANT